MSNCKKHNIAFNNIKASVYWNAVLMLSDGKYFIGKALGDIKATIGEVCFNTSMTGYQEIISDPSYSGQMITFTFPHIGNVGINKDDLESLKIYSKAVILGEVPTVASNYRSECDLLEWLQFNKIPIISNLDTRAITMYIRENGAQMAIIKSYKEGEIIDFQNLLNSLQKAESLDSCNLSKEVITKKIYEYSDNLINIVSTNINKLVEDNNSNEVAQKSSNNSRRKKYHIAVIDFGVKLNILRSLVNTGFKVTVFPCNVQFKELQEYNLNGVFLSNGPGNPEAILPVCKDLINSLFENKIPVFGICLGHQILALVAGLKTYKMQQGHRGANHPVKNLKTNLVEISSQNHGFCVENKVKENINITHISLFDGSIEGFSFKDIPVFSVQYHPESSPGPHDSSYLFEEFYNLVSNNF